MELLKNNSKIENVTLLSAQGAFASLHDDEPVILTIQTMYNSMELKTLFESFELKHLGVTIPLQIADVEVIDSVPLVDLQNIYTYRLLCKKSSTDFTPKTWYKQQYTVLNTRYGHLSGQLQVAEYQVTNLLGSYGSFSVDSDGDGLADGWQKLSCNTYLDNGKQYITATINNTSVEFCLLKTITVPNNNTFFIRTELGVQTKPNIATFDVYILTSDWSNYIPFSVNSGDSKIAYASKITNGTTIKFQIAFANHTAHPQSSVGQPYILWLDNILIVNLTSMGELPQPLKQFFAPSNITKWEDFAIFENTNVMCILKDANGNYIAKQGNDWLNDLIPYVENTANIRMPVYL